jgi:hypothetical protein
MHQQGKSSLLFRTGAVIFKWRCALRTHATLAAVEMKSSSLGAHSGNAATLLDDAAAALIGLIGIAVQGERLSARFFEANDEAER